MANMKHYDVGGYVFDASTRRTPKGGEVCDIKCTTCKQSNLIVPIEIQQEGLFDNCKSTLFLYCDKCDRWYKTVIHIDYSESES